MSKPDLSKEPGDVSSMFDRVSTNYDRTNDILSVGNSLYWRTQTQRVVAPRPGERILDVAAGTGTMSRYLANQGAEVTALDFSAGMVAEGKRRNADVVGIEFVQGDAMDLPFADNTFDATTVSFGLRNVQEPKKALAEMYRVTKPGGRIVICEFSRPTNAPVRAGYGLYMNRLMPGIVRAVSSDPEAYEYLHESIQAWPKQPILAQWMREAGYERVKYRNLSFGIVALHKGWKPTATAE